MQVKRLAAAMVVLTAWGAALLLPVPARAGGEGVTLVPAAPPGFTVPAAPAEISPTPRLEEAAATLDTAANAKDVLGALKLTLTPAQKQFLNTSKFLLVPKRQTAFAGKYGFENCAFQESFDEMLGMFDQVCGGNDPMDRRPENVRFVNPDIVLHGLARYIENALEHLEKAELIPLLADFLENLRAAALAGKKAAKGEAAKRLELVAAQLTVPLVLLQNAKTVKIKAPSMPERTADVPDAGDTVQNALALLAARNKDVSPEMASRMAAELKLAYAAKEVAVSPLFGGYDPSGALKTDYTQYAPRGHYAKNSRLRGYFRAMMYLGRNGWPLNVPAGLSDALSVMVLTAAPGKEGKPLLAKWQRIMEVSGFFAGIPDDIVYPNLRDFVVAVLGKEALSLPEAADPAVLSKLSERLGDLAPPRILSDVLVDPAVPSATKEELLARTKSFRLFGQRFTPDAWIFSRLTAGQEKAGLRLPSMPTALFVPATLGDKTARRLVAEFLAKGENPFSTAEVEAFLGRLDATTGELAKMPDSAWFGSLASGWLYALSTLRGEHGPGWPGYMQGPLFPVKRIESVLGSYAELKHANVLYAKQNYAEAGDGGEEGTPPPVPKGFVEPNPAFWRAVIRLTDTALAGFARYGVLATETEEWGRLARFKKDLALFSSIADKELAGEPVGEEDYELLRITCLSYMNQPFDDTILDPDQCKSAIAADVHTDAVSGRVLYEATAEPYVMLVLVGNESSPRLAVGVAFNHYEFARPLASGRLTDAAWRAEVYARPPRLSAKNGWYRDLVVQ